MNVWGLATPCRLYWIFFRKLRKKWEEQTGQIIYLQLHTIYTKILYEKNVYEDDAAPFTGSCQSIAIMAIQVGGNSALCGSQKYISHRRLNNLWIQSNK